MPKIVELIESTETRGEGVASRSPIRTVTRYHNKDGTHVFDEDKYTLVVPLEEMNEFLASHQQYSRLMSDIVTFRLGRSDNDLKKVFQFASSAVLQKESA